MKTLTCKGCSWLRGVTNIGAGYCAYRDTMVFETDQACPERNNTLVSEVWVSFGESGEPEDDLVSIYWKKPVFDEFDRKYFDPRPGHDCEVEFDIYNYKNFGLINVFKALLPPLDTVKGTRKLLRVTVDIVDQ